MAAIFISHSSCDNEFANDIKEWLAQDGYEQVFLDFDKHAGLQAGDHWERRLYEEIERCHAVVLVLTPNWLQSKWCFVEFTQARALGKIVFPIVMSPHGKERMAPEIQGVDLSDWNADGQNYLRRRIREITDEVARGFTWDRARTPYPGIHSFDADDAAIFFGRDTEIRQVIERLEARRIQGGTRLLMLLGASGSGKSSLLKAGILPQLERDRKHWIALPPFRPDREPISNFAKALAERSAQTGLWREWSRQLVKSEAPILLKQIADDLRIGGSRNASVVIAIDQFEELFTVADSHELKAFLDVLQIATNPKHRLPYLMVGTARSDVLNDLMRLGQFTLQFEDYPLRPMPLDRLPRIIEGPAAVAALAVEKGLAQYITNDLKSGEALPLLAFALRELYECYGKDHRLTIDHYKKLGDTKAGLSPIENVVSCKADDLLRLIRPSSQELDALKRAFIPNLVRVRDDGTFLRQPARLLDLPRDAHRLIEAFVDARLMSKRTELPDREDVVVEVSHEALFMAWRQLRGWLNEEREFLAGKAQLAVGLAEWRAAPTNQKKEALLQGISLRRARQWLTNYAYGLSKDERVFIEASLRQARFKNWLLSGLGVTLVLLIGVALTPRIYGEYVRRTALECDLYAAEFDNNVRVPGVEFDRIITEIAIPACTSATTAEGENPRLMHNLARSLDKAGKYQEAVGWYRKAAHLGWAWSQNNLGVLYLYGRGVERNFAQGVSLLRAAAEKNNEQALLNYAGTDFTALFDDNPTRASILETALVAHGLLKNEHMAGRWGSALVAALELFKKSEKLPDAGLTLRVLDRLQIVGELSASIDESVRLKAMP